MKKTASAFIAILLATGLAVLSACNSAVPPTQLGEGVASPNNSIPEVSIPDESSESSTPDESSDLVIENDVSANMGDTVDIPPIGTPTKLIPIVEFGFGDGDYELGYSKPDEYGFTTGPNGFYVNGNEILVNDHVNGRLLVYRDGKLIDKVDISEYRIGLMSEITDDYYYILDRFGSFAYRIDRKTKEFVPIEFDRQDCDSTNDYTWDYRFITIGDNLYIYGYHPDKEDVCNLIVGTNTSSSTLPNPSYHIDLEGNNFAITDSNGQKRTLDVVADNSKMGISTSEIGRADAYPEYVYQCIRFYENDNYSRYNVYYKINTNGVTIGRYIQLVSSSSFTPIWESSFGSGEFKNALTDDGDLLVVSGDDKHVGIYKVEFGMDEFPFDIPNEETQGDLLNKQSPALNEVNASSENMTYHPRVSRETAEQRALQMINLKWTLKQANKQQPADCNHDKEMY